MTDKTILVTGATGETGASGGHVARQLLARKRKVRVLAHRDDDRSATLRKLGAEIVTGDLLSLNDVRRAIRGVRSAYFVFPLLPTIVDASVVIAQAAKESGVELIVNMSQLPARSDAESSASLNHWLSEQVLNWSGVPVTHIKPTFFMEWLLWIAPMIKQGKVVLPWNGESRYTPVATEDLGRLIATILETPVAHVGKTYIPVGPELIAYRDLAAIFGKVLGKTHAYEKLEAEPFANLLGMGNYTYFKDHCRAMVKDLDNGIFEVRNNLIAEITGEPPMSVEAFVAKHRAYFAAS